MVTRSKEGVWMHDQERFKSVARMVAIDCMIALGLDHINDFRTRDKIIIAISDRINLALDQATDGDVFRRAFESMAAQMIHPKMTALEMAKIQLAEH